MLLTKPHQYAGGGHCTFSPLTSSFGIPFKTGVSVGRRETAAIAIELIGVGIGLYPWHSGSDLEEQGCVQDCSARKYCHGGSKLVRMVAGG